MTTGLSVQRLDSPHELLALAASCDELARRMQPRLPFATSGWLHLWWKHYRERRLFVRDRFFVHTVRDAQGALVALAPLVLTERPGRGPLRLRGLAFFGSDKNVTELRGLICAPEHEGPVASALLAHLFEIRQEWDWLAWPGVRDGTEIHGILNQAEGFLWGKQTTDYILALPATWEEFKRGRSRNIKESLRKCYNSLKRDGHAFNFRVVADPAALLASLKRFFELHTQRANAAQLPHHEDVFAIQRARGLLVDLAARPTEALSMRVFELEIAGKVVASRVGFVLGDELYLYFSGYDPSWAAYSVMTTTVAEAVQWAISQGIKSVNLSPGTDVSKTRWGAIPITTSEGTLLSPTRRAGLVFGLQRELLERSKPGTLLSAVVDRVRRHG